MEYDEGLYTYEEIEDGDFVEKAPTAYDADFMLDDYEAVMLASQIEFFRIVQADVNNIVGYSTDALTITNSDKPYANISDTLQKLEDRYKSAIYKHVRDMML